MPVFAQPLSILLLAQETLPAASGPAGGDVAAPQPMGGMSWLILFGFLGLMLFMTSTAGRKQRKQHEALMASLKKRDRVVTTGGVMGVVVDVFDDRVVLKVDESTNTRMTFVREAISRRIESEQSEDDSANPND
mgnify:FL=1|jgi:preprotein translocase subunit YajC